MRIFSTDFETSEAILKCIQKVKIEFSQNNVIYILFDENIKFVEPFFLILLFNIHEKHKNQNKILVLDILEFSEKKQYVMHRLLEDYRNAKLFHQKQDNPSILHLERDKNLSFIENQRKDFATTEHIIYYYSAKPSVTFSVDGNILDNISERSNFVPITKVTNCLEPADITTTNSFCENNGTDTLKKNINKIISSLFEKGKIDQSDSLISPLANLLFELIDNIRIHAAESNGHICLRHNIYDKKYSFIIGDDSGRGLLETLLETLKSEKSKLIKINPHLKNEIEKSYDDEISLLEHNTLKDDIEALKALFAMNAKVSIHQLPRVIMHFGIPLLMQIVKDLKGILEIYLHRNNRQYKVQLSDSKSIEIEYITNLDKSLTSVTQGTYYIISFDDHNSYSSPVKSTPISIKNSTYEFLFNNKQKIESYVNQFKFTDEDTTKNFIPRIISYKKYIEQKPDCTVSDFFREVLIYTYQHKTSDIIITGFPIEEFRLYILIYIELLYHDENSSKNLQILNILFMNDTTNSVFLLGGNTEDELYAINEKLQKKYHHGGITLKPRNVEYENIKVNTKLFTEEYGILPFELFIPQSSNQQKVLLSEILNNYLENTKIKDIHIDTKSGYYINGFYNFKHVFSDSGWIRRLAFLQAKYIASKEYIQPLYFVGTDKYTSLMITFIISLLNKEDIKIIEPYHVIDDFSNESIERFNTHINLQKQHYHYIILSSVIFTGNATRDNIIDKLKSKNIPFEWLSCINMIIPEPSSIIQPTSILDLDIRSSIENTTDKLHQEPLYTLDEKDKFTLKDVYLDEYSKKRITSFRSIEKVDWLDCIHFTHAQRGDNHYTFYTKTIKFYEKNKPEIENFLVDKKDSTGKISNGKNIIILAPTHNTNNNFVETVDSILFENEATIYRFDRNLGEQNLYSLSTLNFDNASIFFVDDEISSGSTVEYFYSLLCSINPKLRFDGIITLIDRTSPSDETIISNYLHEQKLEKIFAFTTLNIKPIKTGNEECFLCKRQKEYEGLLSISVLDINRIQLAERIVKLNAKKFHDIDYEANQSLQIQIVTFIKMFAVDFIFENLPIKDYSSLEEDFQEAVVTYFSHFSNIFDDKNNSLLQKIFYREASIGLLKACTFPRLVYFKPIRDEITKIITIRLKDEIEKFKNIENLLTSDEIGLLPSELKNWYENKKNVDDINVLFSIAGYLNIDYVMSIDSLAFFYTLAQEIKYGENQYTHDLLHPYMLAVKMVASYNEKQSAFLSKNLRDFTTNNKNGNAWLGSTFTMLHAIFLENNSKELALKFSTKIKEIKKQNSVLKDLKPIIEAWYQDDWYKTTYPTSNKSSITVTNIFINENIHTIYLNDQAYIDGSKLLDSINRFDELHTAKQYHHDISVLYYGAVSIKESKTIELEKTKKLDNIKITWSNLLSKDGDHYFSIIRLVDMDTSLLKSTLDHDTIQNNTPFWFKPIGCIAIQHDGTPSQTDAYRQHLIYSKAILSIQHLIVKFFKEKLQSDTFKDALNHKKEEKNWISYNHGTARIFNVSNKINVTWKNLKEHMQTDNNLDTFFEFKMLEDYTAVIYLIGRIGQKESLDLNNKASIYNVLKESISILNNFFNVLHNSNNGYPAVTIYIDENVKYFPIIISDEDIRIIFFELFFNAAKYCNLNQNGQLNIKISYRDNILIISNNKQIGNSNNREGLQIAHEKITELLHSINYTMSTSSSDKEYLVYIKRD